MKTHRLQSSSRDTKAAGGFTLMEVVVSIGVLAFALTVIVTSIASSNTTAANNSRKALAMSLAESVSADISSGLKNKLSTSALFQLTPLPGPSVIAPTTPILYFDVNGAWIPTATAGRFFKCQLSYPLDPFYSATSMTHVYYVQSRVTWPSSAAAGREDGAVELLSTFTQ